MCVVTLHFPLAPLHRVHPGRGELPAAGVERQARDRPCVAAQLPQRLPGHRVPHAHGREAASEEVNGASQDKPKEVLKQVQDVEATTRVILDFQEIENVAYR